MQVYRFRDKTDELDNAFAEYLKGKSVALVGVSALDDLEQGDFIDSHDVVARVHSPIPYPGNAGFTPRIELGIEPDWEIPSFVPGEWQSRIGSRVNVFYHKEFYPELMPKLLELFYAAGGKFLSIEYAGNLNSYSCVDVRRFAPCRYLTNDHWLNTMEAVGDMAYAGSIIIADILRHDIKSLYITGFPTMLEKDGTLHAAAPKLRHYMTFMNIDWIRRLCRDYEHITSDRNMHNLFEIVPGTWEGYHEHNEHFSK